MSEIPSLAFASVPADFDSSVTINSTYNLSSPPARIWLWNSKVVSGTTPNGRSVSMDFFISCLSGTDTSQGACPRNPNFGDHGNEVQLSFIERRTGLKHTALISGTFRSPCGSFNGFASVTGACGFSPIVYDIYSDRRVKKISCGWDLARTINNASRAVARGYRL